MLDQTPNPAGDDPGDEAAGDDSAPASKPAGTREDHVTFETHDGVHHVLMKNVDALAHVFGTDSEALCSGLLVHCLKPLSQREVSDGSEDMRGFMLAAVWDIRPRDGVERMLAVQMAATHVPLIRQGRWLANVDELPQFEAAERAYNKLARTYTAQMEALRKHRNGGRQTVTVQHVNVGEGGKAIVGNVETGGRGGRGK